MRDALEGCCEQPEHEKWVPLFKIQVFFSCVSFSIIVPSLANYLRRMGAEEWVLGVAVAVYSLGEMVGSAVFGKIITKRLREQPETGPRRALLETMVFGVVGSVLYVLADGVGQDPVLRFYAPWVVVLGRFLGGIWTGGKMVVEQTYVGVAAREDRVTPLTSEIGVYAVLGFVAGPSLGALFSPLNVRYGTWRVDEFTAPGYFVGIMCVAMMAACNLTFDPARGYAKTIPLKLERRLSHGLASPQISMRRTRRGPDAAGLAVCLGAFFAHFYSFAVQETITTPFVTERYGWSQRRVDALFAGVSVLSLVTSVLVARLSTRWSDYDLLVLSLILGFAGSILLLDRRCGPRRWGPGASSSGLR